LLWEKTPEKGAKSKKQILPNFLPFTFLGHFWSPYEEFEISAKYFFDAQSDFFLQEMCYHTSNFCKL
jgi:hypothetical protein